MFLKKSCINLMAAIFILQFLWIPRLNAARVVASLDPTREEFSLHEPVFVELRIENEMAHSVHLDLGKNFVGNLQILAIVPGGSRVEPQEEPSAGGVYVPGIISLDSGAVYKQKLLLNDWVDFDLVGTYRLTLQIGGSGSTDPESPELKASATIRIGRRNARRLEKVCAELADRAMSVNAQSAIEAAQALSFAVDGVCVPAMARVLNRSLHGRKEAVIGLAKLGTLPAINLLVDSWEKLGVYEQGIAWKYLGRENGPVLREALTKAGKKDALDPWSLGQPPAPHPTHW